MTQINVCNKKIDTIKRIIDSDPQYHPQKYYVKSDYVNCAPGEFFKWNGKLNKKLYRDEVDRVLAMIVKKQNVSST